MSSAAIESRGLELPKATILVVDDNLDVLNSMAAVLEVLHEEVLTASNANDALKHLLRVDPAVIVLDVMMPELDGFQLATLIRQRDKFKHTPIIFLTGLGKEDSNMLQGYQAGAVDYLLKPVDPDVFRSKVRIFVELAKKNEMLRRYAELMRANSEKLEEALADALRTKAALEKESSIRSKVERRRDQLAGQLGATPDFVSAMAEGAVTLARDGTVLYCNARFGDMMEISTEELVGAPIERFIATSYIAPFSAVFAEGLQGRVTAEIDLRSGSGEHIPVQVTMNPFSRAEIEAVAMVITDLRHQKRTERMFAEGRLARLMLEHANSGIAVCDELGRIILASRSLEEICGSNPQYRLFDEALPLDILDAQHERRRFSAREVLAGATLNSAEVIYTKANGHEERLLISAGRIVSETGDAVGAVITLLDVSERARIEETLRRSEKLAAAGRIAGTLAHEINNPLSAVTNLLYLLQNSSLDDTARHYVEVAASELARVSHIARNTLSFYREAATPVPVHLNEVVDSVLELFARHVEDKALRITRRYRFTGAIQNFPGELRQVFSNLVLNAIDALPQGGQLTVSVRACRHPQTNVRGVRVLVADRGTGISPEHRGKLFEPFFTTKGEKGTGLGLWVSEGIIHKQGGGIRIRSNTTPGRSGSVFSVFIPSVETSQLLHLTASASHAKTGQARSLITENEKLKDGTKG